MQRSVGPVPTRGACGSERGGWSVRSRGGAETQSSSHRAAANSSEPSANAHGWLPERDSGGYGPKGRSRYRPPVEGFAGASQDDGWTRRSNRLRPRIAPARHPGRRRRLGRPWTGPGSRPSSSLGSHAGTFRPTLRSRQVRHRQRGSPGGPHRGRPERLRPLARRTRIAILGRSLPVSSLSDAGKVHSDG